MTQQDIADPEKSIIAYELELTEKETLDEVFRQ